MAMYKLQWCALEVIMFTGKALLRLPGKLYSSWNAIHIYIYIVHYLRLLHGQREVGTTLSITLLSTLPQPLYCEGYLWNCAFRPTVNGLLVYIVVLVQLIIISKENHELQHLRSIYMVQNFHECYIL